MSIVIYIAIMAAVTYLVRMIPFTLIRKKITSKFLRNFLYYINNNTAAMCLRMKNVKRMFSQPYFMVSHRLTFVKFLA